MESRELNDNLHKLLNHLDSIKDTLPMTILLLEPHNKKANSKFEEFIDKNAEKIENENETKSIAVKYEDARIFEQLSKNSEISRLAMKIIPESLFVSLISQYDSYLNKLLKILFKTRPEYINNSERELSFSQLIQFDSIETAREYVIEKEVETILRKSHSEHFDYLESKLAMPLRRNLFVHCDGIVSNQYLKVCKENKCDIKNIKLNERLNVDIVYFRKAYDCLYELSTKLTHTIWRKLIKNDIENADKSLNEICYSLLTSGQFDLADILLDFACKQTKHFNDSSKNIFIVNRSLSNYLNEKEENAKQIISSKDWSASSDDFKLANLIITEKYDEVFELMKKIGSTGVVDKENYKTWPLFYKLRKETKFKETFKEIFNEDYTVLEIPKRPVQELMEEIIKKKPELKSKVSKAKGPRKTTQKLIEKVEEKIEEKVTKRKIA